METNKIYQGDCIDVLKTFPNEWVDCCISSPPYWALRDYGVDGQLGLEHTFQEYINKLCDIYDEVKRVLKKTGTCWVNLGDTYSRGFRTKDGTTDTLREGDIEPDFDVKYEMADKCLVQIPHRFAIEMTNRGWILRNTIIWYKPNCMPSSVKDRFTVDFEYVFFFVKEKKYWFEQQLEPIKDVSLERAEYGWKSDRANNSPEGPQGIDTDKMGNRFVDPQGRNKRAVWEVCPQPFSKAHFAVYPEKLIEPMVLAGCPKNGLCLDPFMGSGTTGVVAKKNNRNYVGIDLNEEYINMAEARITNTMGSLF